MYVKGSGETLKFYQKAFDAKLVCEYKNDDGGYLHAELANETEAGISSLKCSPM